MEQEDEEVSATSLILKLASGDVLVTDGSLAQKCAAELHKLYAKDDQKELQIGVESQVVELSESVGLWQALSQTQNALTDSDQTVGLLYAVPQDRAAMSDLIKVQDALSGMSQSQKDISAVLIEPSGAASCTDNTWAQAIHETSDEHGVRVIYDVRDYVRRRAS